MDTDRNLLFGVLALQADAISSSQFIEACTLWANQKNTPLADLLVERGWLTPADKTDVERLVERKLQKHGGDVKASLAEVAGDDWRQALAGVEDPEVRHTITGLAPRGGQNLVSTTVSQPEKGQRYTLTRLHAKGGIGQVWVARDGDLGREVALKELRPERADSPTTWARFVEEAKIGGQLEHPGIVPVYELGQRPGTQRPFYTMRFVRGRTLSDAIKEYHKKREAGQAGPLDLRELLGAFVGVCQALAYAHSRGGDPPGPEEPKCGAGEIRRGHGAGLGFGKGAGRQRATGGNPGQPAAGLPGKGRFPR